ncbi:anti-sigma factor family protein [Dactylosporangium siamense]|uniref:Anti-sigma-L factor RslA n=1 Tax=Dactylosporangium siamense TaxID=685454 RepID=A0A919PUY2_9ACTN|nr:zf-HC2 domain-containing protein [Dactylosporangium siamense]GIG51300.1 anti-sigma-L factor RslA [Dactylosporangium siamense]
MSEHDSVRPLLGGYVLGGLDETDQVRVDAHLSGCPDCRAEVDRLAPVPELLQRLPGDVPAAVLESPTRDGVDALLRRARRVRPPVRRRARILVGVAVAVVALAVAGSVVWSRSAPRTPARTTQAAPSAPGSSAPVGTVVQFVAAAGSALSGRATLTPRQWGVSVALELSGLPGDGPFVLRVVGRGGQEEQAACWGRTTSASARVTGASSIQLPNVDKVTISDHDGHLLGTAAQT